MPPPYLRGRGGLNNRRFSRSISPSPNRRKRSWLQGSDRSQNRQRSPSPGFRGAPRKNFKSSPGYRHSPPRSRSQSPRQHKHPKWRSANDGPQSRQQPPHGGRSNDFRGRPRSRSRSRHRSASPKPPPKSESSNRSHHHKRGKASSPVEKFSGPSAKKKPRPSSSVPQKRSPSHSPDLSFSVRNSREAAGKGSSKSRKSDEGAVPPTRKVSSSTKRKAARMTLHKRFTMDDQGPFELNVKDNVTIAILRNPSAKPSEDVTVERIFDATVFKMVHKKHEGRRPIFDRQEIKVWRHDENLTDDPDFERRLIRVKSAPHKVGDSLTRMSPEVLRKAFGLNISGERSVSPSPDRKQQVRLDPRPDPRYEARYRQQMEKQQEGERRRSATSKKRGGDEGHKNRDQRKDEGHVSGKKRNKDDAYDLRHALEQRRSDREESFQIEVQREDNSDTELFYRDQRQYSDDDRNVVFNRKMPRYDNDRDNRGGRRGREDGEPKRFSFGRGRGRGRGIRGGAQIRQDWSPERHVTEDRNRDPSWDRRRGSRPRSFERRGRMSISPPSGQPWRDGGFRGRGRGRGRDFDYEGSDRGSPPADMYYKYSQHDDRDVSPRIMQGRPGRGQRIARGFGSKGFRGTRGFRGPRRPRGFGIRGRGRWGLEKVDRGERFHDVSVEREWKHDMYDSLQTEEEEPHSTTSAN